MRAKRERKPIEKKSPEKKQKPVSTVEDIEFNLSWEDEKSSFLFSTPPVPYFPPALDLAKIYEATYFSIHEALTFSCYQAEKENHFDADALQQKGRFYLECIENVLTGLEYEHIVPVFKKLEQLITEHLVAPKKLELIHIKRFLSRKTQEDLNILNDNPNPASEHDAETPLVKHHPSDLNNNVGDSEFTSRKNSPSSNGSTENLISSPEILQRGSQQTIEDTATTVQQQKRSKIEALIIGKFNFFAYAATASPSHFAPLINSPKQHTIDPKYH